MFKSKIFRASVLIGVLTIVGKLVGLWRDRVLAGQFGASAELDVYYAAFRIPDLVFNLLILGATSSAIVPIFIEYYQRDKASAWRTIQNFLNIMVVGVAFLSVIVLVLAQPIASWIGPGFESAQVATLANLMRIMLVSTLVFAVSTVLGSVLHALQRFLVYALAPVFYSLGIIAGAVFLVPLFERWGYNGIYGLGVGVVLGALLHLLIQLPVALREGFRFGRLFDISDYAFKRMITLMIPRTLALGAYNIGLTIVTGITSLLGSGSITIINLATNLQFVPVSVVGISLATAIFPQLSSDATTKDTAEFKRKLNYALKITLFLTAIIAVSVFVFRELIVDIIFRVGSFSETDRAVTASVLGIFMFSVMAQSLIHIITRAYYAFQNTKTPFLVAIFSIVLNVWLSYALGLQLGMGVKGIAIATVVAYNINFILLYVLFKRRYS
ncbi:MAG: murein biosynthesis integral membrane protein MurJ [Candidatus Yanofskybacteria bacterium RIFCSPLOWO2_02_FULL_47_9b]|uniref:Probable lipid II flippase MurJ n=1 Tax=Candidatus Yanofskybacteria bacterium RIFCSPLOWO2_02_FULL_47_9b TaxID=1802708 RepID=A0A1F8HC64_9BACT|nr:MAG: murein biosynthesis integral membrane protein MurJ [Candidatus Yanofskybacteria bacterium RIFCSPLOWO2_02_FULL_47_9b]